MSQKMRNQSQEIKLEIEGKYGYKITKSKCDKKKKKAFKSHGFLMEKKTHQDGVPKMWTNS